MEGIREAFTKVKNDIDLIRKEFYYNNELIKEDRLKILELNSILKKLTEKIDKIDNKYNSLLESQKTDGCLDTKKDNQAFTDTYSDRKQDKQTRIQTDFFNFSLNSTDISTGNDGQKTKRQENKTDTLIFKPLNGKNLTISTGNGGVQTDKQTDKQTYRQTENSSHNQKKEGFTDNKEELKHTEFKEEKSMDEAMDIIDSLDSIKKELRLKFRRLTDQEMLVFSTIYQQEDEFGHSDYKLLAKKLSLTESSIRDYVRRLINKGIPIEKNKLNNKEIQLSISSNLKKIASLDTILTLKEL